MDTTCFDLIETQQKVREIACPKLLFELWERFSCAYDRKELSKYILDEMQSVVWEQFRRISATEMRAGDRRTSKRAA